MSVALTIAGLALIFYAFVRIMRVLIVHLRLDKNGYLIQAIGFFLLGIARWLDGEWPQVGINAFFCALGLWSWWHEGGDDDWKKRRRKVADWARSHIPRPTIVQVRPLAVPA